MSQNTNSPIPSPPAGFGLSGNLFAPARPIIDRNPSQIGNLASAPQNIPRADEPLVNKTIPVPSLVPAGPKQRVLSVGTIVFNGNGNQVTRAGRFWQPYDFVGMTAHVWTPNAQTNDVVIYFDDDFENQISVSQGSASNLQRRLTVKGYKFERFWVGANGGSAGIALFSGLTDIYF